MVEDADNYEEVEETYSDNDDVNDSDLDALSE